MNIFRRLFGRGKAAQGLQREEIEPEGKTLLVVDTDNLAKEAEKAIWEEIGKITNLPIFEGRVEHGYSQSAVSQSAQCPRCGAKTQQCYAHFIYATNIAPRVMFAPAGFFCTRCPTVIVDEEMIEGGVKIGYTYQGVVGIDYEGKKEPALFYTWNGREPIYIFDEKEHLVGLSTIDSREHDQRDLHISAKERKKRKRKRQLSKRARRRNR
jgi:hypothetical protein